jgi:hypothetical protein
VTAGRHDVRHPPRDSADIPARVKIGRVLRDAVADVIGTATLLIRRSNGTTAVVVSIDVDRARIRKYLGDPQPGQTGRSVSAPVSRPEAAARHKTFVEG